MIKIRTLLVVKNGRMQQALMARGRQIPTTAAINQARISRRKISYEV